jgi:hypothetical protein
VVCSNLLVPVVARIASWFLQNLLTVKLLSYVYAAIFWCDEAYYMMLMTLRNGLSLPRVLEVDHDIA